MPSGNMEKKTDRQNPNGGRTGGVLSVFVIKIHEEEVYYENKKTVAHSLDHYSDCRRTDFGSLVGPWASNLQFIGTILSV